MRGLWRRGRNWDERGTSEKKVITNMIGMYFK